jgi:hypothetical protein
VQLLLMMINHLLIYLICLTCLIRLIHLISLIIIIANLMKYLHCHINFKNQKVILQAQNFQQDELSLDLLQTTRLHLE